MTVGFTVPSLFCFVEVERLYGTDYSLSRTDGVPGVKGVTSE